MDDSDVESLNPNDEVESQFKEEKIPDHEVLDNGTTDSVERKNQAKPKRRAFLAAAVISVVTAVIILVVLLSNSKLPDEVNSSQSTPKDVPIVPSTQTSAPTLPPTKAPTVCDAVDDNNEITNWVPISEDIIGESSFDLSGWALDMSAYGSVVAIGTAQNSDSGQ